MDLNSLEQDCYRRLGFATTTPDSATQTRIRAFLNETQQEILSEPGMEVLLDDSITFASVASTPEYSLPQAVARIANLYETTNRTALGTKSADWYRTFYPDPTAVTGIPTDWVDLGFSPIGAQPSNASELFFKSDSASDDNTKKVYVEGYTSGGYPRSVNVAMNGVTAVSLGATITTWVSVTKFYVALAAGGTTTAAGSITLHEDSGTGTELARIPIGQAYARYRRIALVICPSSALTYTVDFERDVTDLAIASDQPVLPPRFHRLLGIGARMREYQKQDDARRFQAAQAEYLYGLRKLKFYVYSQSAGAPSMRGRDRGRPSRLGAWYPAGT